MALGYSSGGFAASEPTVYSKILTPSPLGKDRVLVLCSLEKSDNEVLAQFYDSVIWDEFSERDLTLVEISKSTVASVLRGNRRASHRKINAARHHDYGDQLRKKADCKDDLEFVLIGKDTGVKARWHKDFTQEDLFNRIDAMPMRRFEMRQQAGKN